MKITPGKLIAQAYIEQLEAQRLEVEAEARRAQERRESQIIYLHERSRLIDRCLELTLAGKDHVILINMVKARSNGKPLPLYCNDRFLDENTSGRDAFYDLANDLEYGLQLRGTEHLRRSLEEANEPLVVDEMAVPFHTKLALLLFEPDLRKPKIQKELTALQSLETASTPEGDLPSDVMAFLLIDVLVVNLERTQQQLEDKQHNP